MKDLTKGKISTLILGFAIPVFLGNLLQLTYSLVHTVLLIQGLSEVFLENDHLLQLVQRQRSVT